MKDKNHDIGRIVLFYMVTIGVWLPLSEGGLTQGAFFLGLILETSILYYLLGLYSSGVSSGIKSE